MVAYIRALLHVGCRALLAPAEEHTLIDISIPGAFRAWRCTCGKLF